MHYPKCPIRIDTFTSLPYVTTGDILLVHGKEFLDEFTKIFGLLGDFSIEDKCCFIYWSYEDFWEKKKIQFEIDEEQKMFNA